MTLTGIGGEKEVDALRLGAITKPRLETGVGRALAACLLREHAMAMVPPSRLSALSRPLFPRLVPRAQGGQNAAGTVSWYRAGQ